MNNRNLVILALIAAIALTVAVIQYRTANQPVRTETATGSYLIQGMDTSSITSIKINEGEGKKLTMRKEGGEFVVADKDGYPADSEKINDLITNLLDVKIQEKVTDSKENFPDLEIGTRAGEVRFFNVSGGLITGVCIGKRAPEIDGSYVRLSDSNNVYLAENTPRISVAPSRFLDKQLLNLDTKKITKITVEDPNGKYTITSEPNSSSAKLEGVPEGKQVKGSDYRRVFSALNRLTFDDVRKESNAPTDLKFDHKYICELSDKRIYELQIAKEGESYFLKCRGKYTGPENITKQRRKESKQELEKKEALLLAQQKVQEFNAKCTGWVYEISEYKAENLIKDFGQLVEDIPEPEKEKEAKTGNAAEPVIGPVRSK